MVESIASLALGNLINPVVLFFILGFAARFFRSDLEIPGNVSKFIAIYLMMAIGYKGGFALSEQEAGAQVIMMLALGAAFSFCLPFLAYSLFGLLATAMRPTERSVIAAHYGSVSVVTFVTATEFLRTLDVAYDSWMVAVMAMMETPAIFAGLLLVNTKAQQKSNHVKLDATVWREIFLNGSVVVLVGSFLIGWIAGDHGMETVNPFFVDIFKGVLCLFMIDIGMVAASKIRGPEAVLDARIVSFGIIMPLIGSTLGALSAAAVGLSLGSTMLFAVLCASASYIAVPAALRIALPQANLSPAITLSLAVTFPFNIVLGLPLYFWMAQQITAIL